MCYVTLRGLVYFGASIHVYHGVQMLVNMYYDLFANSASKEGGSVSQVDIIFNSCFVTLGVLIFRGVELKSKTFIKWPTIGFTLLLAARFIVEIVKQVERERAGRFFNKGAGAGNSNSNGAVAATTMQSPFSYSSMSIDVDPLISAAVGIYIFILFVYNHSLEYDHSGDLDHAPCEQGGVVQRTGSECGGSDGSSDTLLLLNAHHPANQPHPPMGQPHPLVPNLLRTDRGLLGGGDSNNNSGGGAVGVVRPMLIMGGGGIRTRANPLFELPLNPRPHPPPPQPHPQSSSPYGYIGGDSSPPTPPEYKIHAV